jgi:hypothetical protein
MTPGAIFAGQPAASAPPRSAVGWSLKYRLESFPLKVTDALISTAGFFNLRLPYYAFS